MTDHDNEIEQIGKRLQSIELRLNRLESEVSIRNFENSNISVKKVQPADIQLNTELVNDEDKGIESQIGRFGLAWIGNIVLLFGIAFLTIYLMSLGYRFLSVILGYIAAASIYYLAVYLEKSNVHLALMFKLNALILLFYITLRLHFFSATPIIPNRTITVILLLAIVGFQAYLAIRNSSQSFAALSVIFALTTAVIGDTTHFTLPLLTLTAAGTVYYYYRYKWEPLLIVTVVLTYFSYFLWLFSNPFMEHPMQMIQELHFGIIYLLAIGAGYSSIVLLRKTDTSSDDFLIGAIILSGILFTMLLVLVALRFYGTNYVTLFTIITICCLAYSAILKSTSDWNFATAFYALYGFMAMSISLYGLYGFPRVYLLLSVQSLIVVSMALWYRNRLIVIMNSLLFLAILILYLLSSEPIDGVNFSFALVPLISARIINWKRSRLQIKTDLIRNLYMIEGFFMVLFALFHAVPGQFVTLSWTLAALLYFLLSLILKNVKYRYMALGTMISTAFYLFIVDLARIEIIYRVLALLFLAAISIGISMYYTNRSKKTDR